METAKKNPRQMGALITVAVIVLIAMAFRYFTSSSGPAAQMGEVAPALQIDEWITPACPNQAQLDGKVYVLEFWATWCPPCRQSIPHMIELADKYRGKGVVFIGLSTDSSAALVREIVAAQGINYHVGMDKGLADKLGVRGIPAAFIVGRAGRIVWQGHPLDENFEKAILEALG